MQIHRLRLSGFKSFVEPAELRIEPGLTGVVGPNGCGKSNLLEAIRWVMGENSPKSMRSGGMEDVIFAGTDNRPARGFAEVVLTATDDASEEFVVTRRIERGAGSAYRVNGRDVRAKDVALAFADAATGAHSPALVSQGKIAQVIAAKPAERRQMLEEAAGIAGLHVRRKDAESKLRQTEANLARLEDLMAGLDSQMNALKRQARQAERYKALTDDIQGAEARLLFARWRDAARAAKEARDAAQGAEDRVEAAKRAGDDAIRTRDEAATALAEAREAHSDRRDDVGAHNYRMAQLGEKLEAAETRLTDLVRQQTQLEEDRDAADRLTKDAGQALGQLERDLAASIAEVDSAEAERPAIAAATEKAEATARAAELALAKATADHAGVEAEWRVARGTLEQAETRLTRIEAERERLTDARSRLERAIEQQESLEAARQAVEAATDRVARERDTLQREQDRKKRLQVERDEASSALSAARAELAGLEREHGALAKDRDARQRQAKNRDGRPVALDRIMVAPGYERALAAVLGRDAKAVLGCPADNAEGRFWTGSTAPDPVSDSLLAHVTQCPDELRARLALVHCAPNDDGRTLSAGEWLVTHDGRIRRWDGFVAHGEGAAEAARLESANRLDELSRALPALRETAATAERIDTQTRENLGTIQRELIARERELAGAIDTERAALRRLDQAEVESERNAARIEELTAAAKDVDTRIASAKQEAGEAREALSALPAPDQGRTALEAARNSNDGAKTALQSALSKLAAHDQAAAVSRERLAARKADQASWKSRAGEVATRAAQAVARLEEIEQERAVIAQRPAALEAEIAQAETVQERLTSELAAAREAMERCEEALAQAERARETASEALSVAREARATLATRAESEEARRGEMARQSGDRFQCPPPLLPERFDFDEATVGAAEAQSTELEKLLASRERIGPVNLVAAEELARIEEEHGTSASEQAELAEAVGRLRGSISSLNREGRERLRAAFEEVDGHFRELFKRLFQGGQAHLALVDSDDPLEAGLEIYAQPPGKRLQSLSLLSGGEQALTATALIFALFLTNPAPICVLDEVDAPLDDANVERFCDLLDSMVETTRTRYLIVTHNAVTMSRMHRLFGVTMAEQGISRLVSVDLGEAELMAAE